MMVVAELSMARLHEPCDAPIELIGVIHESAWMAAVPSDRPIRHFWLQLELHLKPGASTRIFNAIVAILQVTPATQPASCTLPIASHCIPRLQLLQFLTLSVAGARYLAKSGPRFEPGSALEPSQGCGRSRRAASAQPSSSTAR